MDLSRRTDIGHYVGRDSGRAGVAGVQFTAVFKSAQAGGFTVSYQGSDGARLLDTAHPTTVPELLKQVVNALVAGEPDTLTRLLAGQSQADVGDALFSLLFPGDAQPLWRTLYKMQTGLTASSTIHPSRLKARVRIQSDDPLLQILPWQLAGPKGRVLTLRTQNPWTFELTSAATGAQNPQLLGPPTILAIMPGTDGFDLFSGVRDELRARQPAYGNPRFLKLAQTREAVIAALDGFKPSIVYFVGHCEEINGAPTLQLDDGGLSGQVLRQHCKRVQVAIFAGCNTGQGGRASLGNYLADCVPGVISTITKVWSQQAVLLSEHWLRLIALDGVDPVTAAHRRPDHARIEDFHGWTFCVHGHYDTWKVENAAVATKVLAGKVSHRLDRITQRAKMQLRLGELRRPGRAVLALIGFSSQDASQLPDELSDLLLEDLKDRRSTEFTVVDLPVDMATDPRWMMRTIKQALGDEGGTELGLLLQSHAPPSDGIPMLWLNFGTFGKDKQFNALSVDQFDAWLVACDEIAAHCPTNMRVVTFMAIDSKSHDRLSDRATEFELGLTSARLHVEPLSVLLHVNRKELQELFVSGGTSCPPALRVKVVRALFGQIAQGASRANYRELVNEIDYAEQIGWLQYLAKAAPASDDPIDI